MNIGVVGGGINGLCCAWKLAERGHQVTLYEKDELMKGTSRASSKLLHGGLRYLENGEFRLVREALRERDAWLRRAPNLAWPLRLTLPIYRNSRRNRWLVGVGMCAYDHIAGRSDLPKSHWKQLSHFEAAEPGLMSKDLIGGYVFYDAQMNDYELGMWVAAQAQRCGVNIRLHTEVVSLTTTGDVALNNGVVHHERVINVAGPWAQLLLDKSGIRSPIELTLVRGSHVVITSATSQAYLLESPISSRVFFVLPWLGKTLVGTTERAHSLGEQVICTTSEKEELIASYRHYFPTANAEVCETFSGLRPLVKTKKDLSRTTREYAIRRTQKLISVFGGKWTTAMALADKVSLMVQ